MTILAREIFSLEHEMLRETARKFFEQEVAPHHRDWEKQGVAPRSVWRKAGEAGLLCVAVPEAYGGCDADRLASAILIEEQARLGLSGPGFSTHSDIVAPYILNYGTEAQKLKWLPGMASG
ncbi:MAG: acyl-CoA dehydrogenase family protein, partial [Nitratireductor sp.]